MNDSSADIGVLRKVSILSALQERELLALSHALRPGRLLPAGETLFRQDDPGDCLYILTEGQLSVHLKTPAGPIIEVAELAPGEVVGEMSCLDPAPRCATIRARKPSRVYELGRPMLELLRQRGPGISCAIVGAIIEQVTARLRDADRQIEEELARRSPSPQGASSRAPAAVPPAERLRPRPFSGRLELHRVKGLEKLSQDLLDFLRETAPPMLYGPKMDLCREGDPGSSCYLLVQGQVEIIKQTEAGPRVLATLGPGAMVGQMALVDRAPRSATVRTVESSVALELGRKEFQGLLANQHPIAIHFQEQVAVAGIRQLRMADSRLAMVLSSLRTPAPAAQPPTTRPAGRADLFRTALKEWGISMSDLDEMEVVRPDGVMSSAELRARSQGRK